MARRSSKRNRLGRAKDRAKKKPAAKKTASKKADPVETVEDIDITLGTGGGSSDLVRAAFPKISPRRTGGGFANMPRPSSDPLLQRELALPSNRMSSGGKVGSKSRDGIAISGLTKGRFV